MPIFLLTVDGFTDRNELIISGNPLHSEYRRKQPTSSRTHPIYLAPGDQKLLGDYKAARGAEVLNSSRTGTLGSKKAALGPSL